MLSESEESSRESSESESDSIKNNRRSGRRRQSRVKKKESYSRGKSTNRSSKSNRQSTRAERYARRNSRSPSPSTPELAATSTQSSSSSSKAPQPSHQNITTQQMTMANPFYHLKPCKVTLHKLSSEFIEDATSGKINWKGIFKGKIRTLDLESYVKTRVQDRTEKEDNERKRLAFISASPEENDDEDEESNDKDADYNHTSGPTLRTRRPRISLQIFKCKECSFTTNESENLTLHMAVHASLCEECNLTFENKFKYQLHVYETHKPPVPLKNYTVYGCKVCQDMFDIDKDAYQHLASHAEVIDGGKYACALCKATYAKEERLTTHLTTKHIYFKCTFCAFLGSSFDILERHSANSHAAYGKPYPCDFCDFRCSTWGASALHRKSIHAFEKEGEYERCRLCHTLLLCERELLLEHIASHVECCLLQCKHCDFRCNSFQLMRSHGLEFHAAQDINSFAMLTDLNELAKGTKRALDVQYGKTDKKKTVRSKPTINETNEALAGLNSSNYMSIDPILTSPVKVIPMESSNLNIQGVMSDQESYLASSIYGYSNLNVSNDPMISFTDSSIHTMDRTVLSDDGNFDSIRQDQPENINHFEQQQDRADYEKLNDDQNSNSNDALTIDQSTQFSSTQFESPDPVAFALESAANNGVIPSTPLQIPSEGVLSVDPESGQLFLQGLPVYDEKGQAIYVAIHETAQVHADAIKDVQTANEESAEPVPNGELS